MDESEIQRYTREYGMDSSDEEAGGEYREKKSTDKSSDKNTEQQEEMLPGRA
jgi:hypothetical protein